MNIVMITTGKRPELLRQSIESFIENSARANDHTITLVVDGPRWQFLEGIPTMGMTVIVNPESRGASACRNIGAGSIPRYRRQEHVLFLDDDVYMAKDWDARLMHLATWAPRSIISGYSHPYNQVEEKIGHNITERDNEGNVKTLFEVRYGEPLVISSVAMMMPWAIFDEVGPWDEPGGPGASEDYAISMRAKEKGYGFAVTSPQCIVHCGLRSSTGKKIVGHEELIVQNMNLLELYGIEGKVVYG
jgi:GT2 family glycosyltransferase